MLDLQSMRKLAVGLIWAGAVLLFITGWLFVGVWDLFSGRAITATDIVTLISEVALWACDALLFSWVGAGPALRRPAGAGASAGFAPEVRPERRIWRGFTIFIWIHW